MIHCVTCDFVPSRGFLDPFAPSKLNRRRSQNRREPQDDLEVMNLGTLMLQIALRFSVANVDLFQVQLIDTTYRPEHFISNFLRLCICSFRWNSCVPYN